jgi:hypothetical protein
MNNINMLDSASPYASTAYAHSECSLNYSNIHLYVITLSTSNAHIFDSTGKNETLFFAKLHGGEEGAHQQ